MTLDEIKQALKSPAYDFLRTDPHLGKRTIMLTVGGSHAYGTNIETSDLDIRGCTLQSRRELIGFERFEQVIDNATDTTIYAFNKFISLLINCNPNIIELLGNKPEHYLYLSDIGKELVENRHMFFSQKAIRSFCGYTNQQLRQLKNATARNYREEDVKEQHLLETIKASMADLADTTDLLKDGRIAVNIPRVGEKISCSVNVENYPLREFAKTLNNPTRPRSDRDSFYSELNCPRQKNPISPAYGMASHTLKTRKNPPCGAFVGHIFRPSNTPVWHTPAAQKLLVKDGPYIR